MITFSCSACGQRLKVKDDLAGKKGKCPHCGEHIAIPDALAVSQAGVDDALGPTQALTPAHESIPSLGKTRRGPDTGTPPQVGKDLDTPAPRSSSAATKVPAELYEFLAPPQAPDELGRLGSYRVLRVLGTGGMGIVFLAEDIQLKRLVALKVMKPAIAAGEVARQRFLREARSAAAIEHDHIVSIHQVGEDRGLPFLAMQFLRGEPLNSRLRREGKLRLQEVLRIGREIAEGLVAAHEHGLIHRDIKPDNIWLENISHSNFGRVKILDFGLARAAEEEAHLTQDGAIMGTPMYMAPEQAEGAELDARCDLFSLGCVLYRMSTGHLPFKGKGTINTLVAVATQKPQSPLEIEPNLPPVFVALIMRLLEKDPKDRPQSAEEVVEALARIERSPELSRHQSASSSRGTGPAVRHLADTETSLTEVDEEPLAPRRKITEDTGTGSRNRLALSLMVGLGLVVLAGACAALWAAFKKADRSHDASANAGSAQVSAAVTDSGPAPGFVGGSDDRKVAEWALKLGAWVRIATLEGKAVDVNEPGALPSPPFQLVALNLSNNRTVNDQEINKLPALTALRQLALGGTAISDLSLQSLGRCGGLQVLYLNNTAISDSGLGHLKSLSQLQTLVLNHTRVSDNSLQLLSQFSSLTHLDVASTAMSAGAVEKLRTALAKCNVISDQGGAPQPDLLAGDRKAAEWALNLGGKVGLLFPNDGTTAEISQVSDLPSTAFELESVSLTGNKINDGELKNLDKVNHLKALTLDGTPITDGGLASLSELNSIKTLSLAGTEVSGEGLKHLRKLGNLTYLNLSGTPITDGGLGYLQRVTSLKILLLNDTRISDPGLEVVKNLGNLQSLYVKGTKISDLGLGSVKQLPMLQVLSLENTRIGDAGLERLKNAPALITLMLSDTKVSDNGLKHVAEIARLQGLFLAGTSISDAGLAHLKDLINLTQLSLARTGITLAGARTLEGLANLKWLDLKGAQLNEVDFFELKKLFPECEIQR